MNDVSLPTSALAPMDLSASAMILNPEHMRTLTTFADSMARAVIAVPQHFRGKPADCLAVCLQAMTWGMNPFAVSQKTHVTQGGQLGYEGQLINAVIIQNAPIDGRPEFEFLGDWSKVLGKVKEMTSDKGGKYYVAAWDKKDEDGLGVRCSVKIRGESAPRSITVMMSQAYPRFSTQWATDPQQQITFLAVRKLARRYFPDVILGVYDLDEVMSFSGPVIDVGSGQTEGAAEAPAQKATAAETVRERVRQRTSRKEEPTDVTPTTPPPVDEKPKASGPAVTLAQVLRSIDAAKDEDGLAVSGDLARTLVGADQDKAREAYAEKLRALRNAAAASPPPPPPPPPASDDGGFE